MGRPQVSFVILTWNHRELAPDAVASALAQGPGTEVLVYDNASTDGTTLELARRFGDRVRIVRFPRNLGYAGGYNRALRLAEGEILVLQNPDVRLDPGFADAVREAFAADPRVGIVAPLLLRPDRRTVDSSGQFLARSRKTIDRGYGRPHDPRRDRPGPVLSACGAAACYRREMVEDIADGPDLFERDYFAWHEDLEVGWRAWRAGWQAVHVPRARAVHLRTGGRRGGIGGLTFELPPHLLAHVLKNRYLAMIRHDRLAAILLDLPWILAREAAQWSLVLAKRPAVLREVRKWRRPFRRALARRREDRDRTGRWGPWRRDVPPRGTW